MTSWAPHSFKREAEAQGCQPDAVSALVAEGNRLFRLGLPVVFTLGHLASLCGVPYDLLDKVVKRINDPYRTFRMRKRNGGFRQISVPEGYLLTVQRWIHTNILLARPVSQISTAFAPNCDPVKNADRHKEARWLVKIDVANFFDSVSERQVYRVFRNAGYPALMAFQFSRLCTRVSGGSQRYEKSRWQNQGNHKYAIFGTNKVGNLPQGAPTSPMLANLVCVDLDAALLNCASDYNCAVTRYADDIVFSASELTKQKASEIIKRTAKLLGEYGLVRRNGKTHVATPGSRRVVTGLLVDHTRPRLTKEFRERILLHLYHAKRHGISEHCERRQFRSLIGFRAHLNGLITYAEHVDPIFGNKCRLEFKELDWGDLSLF